MIMQERYRFLKYVLNLFNEVVFGANREKYIHFVTFHICSLSPKLSAHYLNSLLNALQQGGTEYSAEKMERAYGARYVASLVARGRFIDTLTAYRTVRSLVEWAHVLNE